MTNKAKLEMEAPKVPRKKYRKLSKAEEEEWTREFNRFYQKISAAVQEGSIVLPEKGGNA